MSDTTFTQKKKKSKSNKPKSKTTKSSKSKKKKTRLTREYRENEKEVQQLLEKARLSIDIASAQRETDDVSESVEFFCGNGEHELIAREAEAAATAGKHDDSSSEAEEDNGSKASTTPSTTHGNQMTASTYIQIDEEALLRQQMQRDKHEYEEELLYEPAKELDERLKLQANDEKVMILDENTVRLLNRYCVELQAICLELSTQTIDALKPLQRVNTFMPDKTRYNSYCAHEFHPIFCEPAAAPSEIPTRKFIKICIKELLFTEHPQLCAEHRLSNTLEAIYERYAKRLQAKIVEKMASDLQTERKIVSHLLKREVLEECNDDDTPGSAERRMHNLEQHLLSVKALRNGLYEEEAENKRLLKQILDTWIKLKSLRKEQAYQCTRFKLRIQVEETPNAAAESHKWTQRFETDMNELYREELETYYRAKRLWKSRDRTDVTLLRPRKPDIEKLAEELKTKLAECLHMPGEPKLNVQLNRVSDEEFYHMPGQRRLKSFFMKIYFDQDFVSETRSYRMEPDLRLPINEVIGIFLERRLPKDIRIALYEKSKLPTPKKMADIILPLPFPMATTENFQTQVVNFTQKQLAVAGRLWIRFHCDEENYPKDALNILLPPRKAENPELLREWHPKQLLTGSPSPNNNEDSIQTDNTELEASEVEEAPESAPQKPPAITCTFEEQLLEFCPREKLENNARFKLLRSRYLKNDARTKDLQLIPALENELEFDWEEQDEPVIEAGNWMDPIDLHKHEGKKYLRQLYEAIRDQCMRLNKVMESAENLLIGDEPASWSSFFQLLGLIFHPSRPLNPQRNNVKSPTTLSSTLDGNKSFNIAFNVVRATGIPVRSGNVLDSESRQRSSGSSNMFINQNLKYSNVRPFVTLSYRDKLCRTMTAEGSNPTWNEQLSLQLSGSLKDLRDDLKISLFDEVIESHLNDELSVRNMDVYQRIQTNWLGEYRIPISSLLAIRKLEGVFELNTPKVILGYKRPSLDNITTNSDTNISIEHYPEIRENIRIWFYISLEPNFDLPRISTACLECAELKEVRQHLHEWSLEMQLLKPQRFIEPLVCTADGKRACITRLLEPVPLPIEASENLLDTACRFVSLLSVLKNYDACMGFQGIWLNNQILLDTTWGSAKDLGVLLCNYLLSIGIPCWLVLGLAWPYGESAFVLYRSEEGDLQLIDPTTGRRFNTKDTFCPLNKVSFVIAQDNLYCNIQREDRVSMTNFNFNDSACWLSSFSKRNPAPLGGIQKLNYSYLSAFNTYELRKNIERKVMKKINTWRTMRKTIWNRAFQTRLQHILLELEHVTTFSSALFEESKYTDQFAAEYPSFKIYGFTLNFPYTNLTSISDRIKSTGIHLNSDKTVEYSLAVHINAYPNNVLSVWIFLISIIKL